jgi:hypothetical protein
MKLFTKLKEKGKTGIANFATDFNLILYKKCLALRRAFLFWHILLKAGRDFVHFLLLKFLKNILCFLPKYAIICPTTGNIAEVCLCLLKKWGI